MSQVRFTKSFINNVLAGKEGPGFWKDSESRLGLSRSPGGSCSWRLVLKIDGKAKTLSPCDATGKTLKDSARFLSLSEARHWASQAIAAATLGKPLPGHQKRSERFSALAESYLQAYCPRHTPKALRSETYSLSLVLPKLGHLSASQIKPIKIKEAISDLETPSKQRLAYGVIKRVLDLAVEQESLEINPALLVKAPKPAKAKSRYPNLQELKAIWQACEDTKGISSYIFRFAICLPLRANTLTSLTWSEVDLESSSIALEANHGRKLAENQRLPLPSLAVELLQQLPQKHELVFGSDSKTNIGGQFSGWSAATKRIQAKSNTSNWSIHDFRRSMVSIIAEYRPDISADYLDLLLTHKQSSTRNGVKGVYQRSAGYKGMQLSVNAWDSILREALSNLNQQE